jgi:pyruvate,water dikinase
MNLEHLEAVATKRAEVVGHLVATHEHTFGAPLPASFQMTDLGKPVRVATGEETGSGTGAGGGRAVGPVTFDIEDPPAGSILVTTTLTPALGPMLPRLGGIVSETGSVLSHLAILAREAGVATVVGYAGARTELKEGAVVAVDGGTGCVTVQEDASATPATPDEETAA